MGHWDDVARRRIKLWMAGRNVNRTQLGEAAGYNQPWATRFLEGEHNADLDALGRITSFFAQPMAALFESREDAQENEVIDRFRGLTEQRKQLFVEMLRDWVPDQPPLRGRARAQARTAASAPATPEPTSGTRATSETRRK